MEVRDLVDKYKRVRNFAKWKPFILNAAYIAGLLLYILKLEDFKSLAEILFFTTPINCFILLRESFIIGLCNYHKTACLLPMFNFCTLIVHRYIYNLGFYKDYYNYTFILVSATLIICGYFVFFCKKN